MKANDFLPKSNYLKIADFDELEDDAPLVTIEEVTEETFEARDGRPAETKLLVHFLAMEKGLLLNKTNLVCLIDLFGDDTDDWIGHKIRLMLAPTRTPEGKTTKTIMVLEVKPKKKPAAPAAAAATAEQAKTVLKKKAAPVEDEDDDEKDDPFDNE